MNEHDIEERLRSVTQGQQPTAPASLRHFLHDLPEAEAARRNRPFGRVRGAFDRLHALVPPFPYARRAQMAFGVMAALVIGVASAGVLLSLRQTSLTPAASGTNGTPCPNVGGCPWETPIRSIGVKGSPVVAVPTFESNPSFPAVSYSHVTWTGTPLVGDENMALPVQAVSLSVTDGDYIGVAMSGDGLVRSQDALYWDWSPASQIDPLAAAVTSIAYDESGTVVVAGAAQGVDGTMDGRIWYSTDDGATWKPAANEAAFAGVEIRKIVHGSGKFVALGWNDLTPADARREVGAWTSLDGITWDKISVPIQGTAAVIAPTASGFVLSGTPLAAASDIDQVPIWQSSDLLNWNRGKANDHKAQLIGPVSSVSVDNSSYIFAISPSTDGMSNKIIFSSDGGATWQLQTPSPDAPIYVAHATEIATFTVNDNAAGYFDMIFISTATMDGSHIYVSLDKGITWARVIDPNVGGPNGKYLIEIGAGYLAGGKQIVACGDQGGGLGVWLARLDAMSR